MRLRGLITTILLFCLVFAAEAKPFRRVLIMAGGGLSLATYSSVIEHLEMYGKKPDVIIATCGSSMSALIASSFKTRDAHMNFVTSNEFHRLMRTPRVVMKNALEVKNLIAPVKPSLVEDMFENYILEAPQTLSFTGALSRFPTSGTRLIFGAARARHKPGQKIQGSETLFEETYFTDAGTAQYLRGQKSAIARNFPRSRVADYITVKTGVSPAQAARASISDPVLINPGKIGDSYYFTGGMNLYPIELAKSLGDEVWVTYPLKFPQYQSDIAVHSFGFSVLERQEQVSRMSGVRWIDMHGKDDSFNPEPFLLLRIKSGVPGIYSSFKSKIKQQWNFGWRRAYEAVTQYDPRNPTAHISKTFDEQKGH
jgi:hypothetical protein